MKDTRIGKRYMVFNQKNEHEYNISVEENNNGILYKLYYSARGWTEHTKNKLALSLFDDGNSVKFNKVIKSCDYGLFFEMRLLINFKFKSDPYDLSREMYRVIEDKTIIEV